MRRVLIVFLTILFGLLSGFHVSATASPSWYLRGAIGVVQGEDADFSDDDCSATSPPALFGCGAGSDGESLGAYGDFGEYFSMEIAGGQYVYPWLRTDMALNYRPNLKYSGLANFRGVSGQQPVSTTARSLSLMANLFIELAPALGFSPERFHPYLGAGFGVSYNRLKAVKYRFPEMEKHKLSVTPSGERFNPAFMIFGGLGISLTPQWMLDISGRYEDLGEVGTDRGGMYMDHIDGEIEIARTNADLRGFGFMMGMRYLFRTSL